jgi:hypothetical protein
LLLLPAYSLLITSCSAFRFRDSHFVILNTDPFGAVGTVPVNWLNGNLVAAHHNPHIRHIFVLAHKQAFTPQGISSEQALDSRCVAVRLAICPRGQ